MAYATFSPNFRANIITSLGVGSIREDYYAFINHFIYSFKPYKKAYMASSFFSSGNTTTILSNAVIYFYMEPHCCSSYNLSLETFLSSSGAYQFMNIFSKSGKLFGALPYALSLSICFVLPPISATVRF